MHVFCSTTRLVALASITNSAAFVVPSTLRKNNAGGTIYSNKPTHNAIHKDVISSTFLQSSIMPIPTNQGSGQNNLQPVLDEDDIHVEMAVPKAGTVMKMLPKESFDIHTPTSLMYFGIDFAAVATSMGFLNAVVTSDNYHNMPIWMQGISVAPLQVLTGFSMWCMWCIGHDAGHDTVSKNKNINRVVGEIAHSMICLTPFVPWAKSHRQHHLNHNHLEKDYSHQWLIREEADELQDYVKVAYKTRIAQLPMLYFAYLVLGISDGGHVIFYGRMWENSNLKEKLDAAISVAISMATAGAFWYNMGTADFSVVCMVPWLVCSFWLFMVTYLQHHSDDGKLYTDDTYSFEKGAFETVDRNYGKWINRMSHHMMDGHVVHHLFFSKVPHYRLEEATVALKKGLEERGQLDLYKFIDTPKFYQEIVKQFDDNWFFINESQIVRK